jgi:hypothetical protein
MQAQMNMTISNNEISREDTPRNERITEEVSRENRNEEDDSDSDDGGG